MEGNDNNSNYVRRPNRIGPGLFVLVVGCILLLDQMGIPFPDWLFSWHILLIAFGIFIGLRHGFRGGAWMIMILVGSYFFLQDHWPHFPLQRFMWPSILIVIGLIIMVRPRHRPWRGQWREQWRENQAYHYRDTCMSGSTATFGSSKESFTSEDFIDSTAFFAGIHKKVVSKNFRGGDITSVMGGTELDLTQADFTGFARLDVTQLMGGTKIIVPPHWEVRSEVTAIFAGFEDKRQHPAVVNPDKVLILSGTSIMGGIELKNF